MKQKCLLIVLASILGVAFAASISQRQQRADAIPVQVVYDHPNVRNVEEKSVEDEYRSGPPIAALKNLDARPQVSSEHNKQQNFDAAGPIDNEVYNKIHEIINNGAKKIHNDFENIPDGPQKQQILEKVDSTLEEFLDNTKRLIALRGVNTLKQDATTTAAPGFNPFGVFPQILSLFQTFSSNLVQGFSGAVQPSAALSDATTSAPGGFPNPVTIVLTALGQVQDNLSGFFNAQPAQNDETPGAPPASSGNPFQFIQQTVSNFFGGQSQAQNSQNDQAAPAPPVNPVLGFVQNAINAFQPTTSAPAVHDEPSQGTTSVPAFVNGSLTFLQTAQQNVVSGLQNIVPGQSSPSNATHVLEGSSSESPAQSGQNIVNQISAQFPNNPIQQQAQQAAQQGSSQASQVVGQFGPQGVPDQITSAISQAQSIAGQGSNPSPSIPSVPSIPNIPAIPSIPNTRAEPIIASDSTSDEPVADDVVEHQEEHRDDEVPVLDLEPLRVPVNEEISNEVNETQEAQIAEEEIKKEPDVV